MVSVKSHNDFSRPSVEKGVVWLNRNHFRTVEPCHLKLSKKFPKQILHPEHVCVNLLLQHSCRSRSCAYILCFPQRPRRKEIEEAQESDSSIGREEKCAEAWQTNWCVAKQVTRWTHVGSRSQEKRSEICFAKYVGLCCAHTLAHTHAHTHTFNSTVPSQAAFNFCDTFQIGYQWISPSPKISLVPGPIPSIGTCMWYIVPLTIIHKDVQTWSSQRAQLKGNTAVFHGRCTVFWNRTMMSVTQPHWS